MMTKHRSAAPFFFDRVVLQHPKIVILCVLAAATFLAFQARHFRLDASAETLVLENDQDLRYARLISSRYGQHDFLVLTYSPRGEMFSAKTLATLARLRDDLRSLERVSSVLSILDAPLLESPPVSLKELNANLPTLESPTVDRDLARIELRDSPLYQNLLLSSDSQTTALLINFADDDIYGDLLQQRNELRQKKTSGSLTSAERAELKRVAAQFQQHRDKMRRQRHQDIVAIRTIVDNYRGDADLFLGGVSMIADDMITFIKNDLKVFGLGVLLFLILTLGLIFGRLRWICLPMLCCVVSVICMIGLLGWFGWEVTVISANFISLQLIFTMAITIHLIVRYRELLVQSPEAPNRELILDAVRLKLKPCVYAVLTTIAGFGSLVFCDILPVIAFGWMMIAGLMVSLIVTFLLFPAVLMLIPKEAPPGRRGWRFSPTSVLARFTEANGVLILGLSGFALIFSLIGISKLEVENSFIDYFKETTEIHQGMKIIDQRLGGTTPLDVIVEFEEARTLPAGAESPAAEPQLVRDDDVFDEFDEFDEAATDEKYWFTAEKMRRVKVVHHYLDNLPETGKVLSLATMLGIAEKLNGGKPLDSFELALLYSETPDQFKTMLIEPYVSVEHDQARFGVRVRDSEKTLRRNELVKKIKADLTGTLGLEDDQIHLAGLLVLYNNMLQSLFRSQIMTVGLTVLVLTGMFLVLFRSLKIALIAMLANVLPIAVVLGVMGWLKIPLDMMTITLAAISLGIAVDDTIHYIHRFKHELQKDRRYLPTMHRCHRTIGHAMYYTSVTIIIGFSILALSNFIPSVYFGLLTGLAMLIALLAALTLLPQMLILVKPFGKETRTQRTEGRRHKTDGCPLLSVLCYLSFVILAVTAAGCAVSDPAPSVGGAPEPTAEPQLVRAADEDFDLLDEELVEQTVEVADPLEPWNRMMYHVNDGLYFWVFKPIGQAYRDLTPEPARIGIRNFFHNLSTPARLVNCLLQGKGDAAGTELNRFVINSTAGVLGFGDPARDEFGLEPAKEDLGQTLAVYGFADGFYIVWPVFGPSTIRDSVGKAGDQFLNPTRYIEPTEISIGISAVRGVNEGSFHIGEYEVFKSEAVEPYVAMRQAYIQYRNKQVQE